MFQSLHSANKMTCRGPVHMARRWVLLFVLVLLLNPLQVGRAAVIGWVHEVITEAPLLSALSDPALKRGNLVYMVTDQAPNPGSPAPGVYARWIDGTRLRIAGIGSGLASGDSLARFNGFSATGAVVDEFRPAVDEFRTVSFGAVTQSGAPGIFASSGGEIRTVAVAGQTPITRPSGVLSGLTAVPSGSFGLVGFGGTGPQGNGPFVGDATALSIGGTVDQIARVGTNAPTTFGTFLTDGRFREFGEFPTIAWNFPRGGWDMAFRADTTFRAVPSGADIDSDGIYVALGLNNLQVVAERFMPMPGRSTEQFQILDLSPSISNGRVAFHARGNEDTVGIYIGEAGRAPTVVVDTHTAIPGGSGTFSRLNGYSSIDNGAVAFVGAGAGGRGVYTNYGGTLVNVIDDDELLVMFPDESLMELSLFHAALSGNQIAFRVTSTDVISGDATSRIILSTAISVPLPGTAGLVLLALPLAIGLSRTRPRLRQRTLPRVWRSLLKRCSSVAGAWLVVGSISVAWISEADGAVIGWIHQVIAENKNAPGSFADPALERGNVAYMVTHKAPPVTSLDPGVYALWVDGTRVDIARIGTPLASSATLEYFDIVNARPAIDHLRNVSFAAATGDQTKGIFVGSGGAVRTLALAGQTPISGQPGVLTKLGNPSGAFGSVAFDGTGPQGQGIYMLDADGAFSAAFEVVRVGMPAPTTLIGLTDGRFTGFGGFPTVNWNFRRGGDEIAFLGDTTFKNRSGRDIVRSGIYAGVRNDIHVIAEEGMRIPGRLTERFGVIRSSPSISDGRVAFHATGDEGTLGIYFGGADVSPRVVVDSHTAVPGGSGTFSRFGEFSSIDGDVVAFFGEDQLGKWGVYTNFGGTLVSVFDADDLSRMFVNEVLTDVSLFHEALSGNQIAFRVGSADLVSGDGVDRIVLATAITVPLPGTVALILLPVAIVLIRRTSAKANQP